ncbi:hypothetical protein LZ30DRAFT_717802 [Colletotrichum cereale]|nr:hypothetical protein LZ30DRAFT_717802 [Colletotrichum cereale]
MYLCSTSPKVLGVWPVLLLFSGNGDEAGQLDEVTGTENVHVCGKQMLILALPCRPPPVPLPVLPVLLLPTAVAEYPRSLMCCAV